MKKIVLTFFLAINFLLADDNSSLTAGDITNYFGSFFGGSKDQNTSNKALLPAPPAASGTKPEVLPLNAPAPSLSDMGLVDPTITPKTVLDFAAPKPKSPIQKELLAISSDGKSAFIDGAGLQKGISGLVWSQLDDTHRVLVARAYVSGIQGDKARVRFAVLEDTAQSALPSLLNRPKVGDNVVFYLLEDRGVVIAPNQTDYQNAIWTLPPELKLIHPDLFAAYLTPIRSAEPRAKQFRAFCANIQATNIYFTLSDGIYKTDCFTLAVLEKYPFKGANEPSQKPFYNRIGEIPTGYFGMFKEDMKDYQSYYKDLLGIKQ